MSRFQCFVVSLLIAFQGTPLMGQIPELKSPATQSQNSQSVFIPQVNDLRENRPLAGQRDNNSERGETETSPITDFSYETPANQAPSFQQTFGDRFGDGGTIPLDKLRPENSRSLEPQQLIPLHGEDHGRREGPSNTRTQAQSAPDSDETIENQRQTFRDNNIRAATFNDLDEGNDLSNSAAANSDVIKKLLESFRLTSYSEPLPGVPLTVQEAIRQTGPQNRKAMIDSYWTAYGNWAEFVLAREQTTILNSIGRPTNNQEVLLLNGARSLAECRIKEAELELHAAQATLQTFLYNPNAESLLALPADVPLVQNYTTHFEWYASRNRVPPEHRAIHLMLPKMKALIDALATATQINQSAMNQIVQGTNSGPSNLANALQSVEQAFNCQRKLVRSVVNYNRTIGDYALTIAPFENAPENLANMLVAPINPPNSVLDDSSAMREARMPNNANRQPEFRNQANTRQPISRPLENSGSSLKQANQILNSNRNQNVNVPENPGWPQIKENSTREPVFSNPALTQPPANSLNNRQSPNSQSSTIPVKEGNGPPTLPVSRSFGDESNTAPNTNTQSEFDPTGKK